MSQWPVDCLKNSEGLVVWQQNKWRKLGKIFTETRLHPLMAPVAIIHTLGRKGQPIIFSCQKPGHDSLPMSASFLMLTETPGEIADLQQQQSDLIYGPKQLTGGAGHAWRTSNRSVDRIWFLWCGHEKSLGVVFCFVFVHVINHPCFFCWGGGLLVDVFGKSLCLIIFWVLKTLRSAYSSIVII